MLLLKEVEVDPGFGGFDFLLSDIFEDFFSDFGGIVLQEEQVIEVMI